MISIFIGTRIEALEKLEEFTDVIDIITIKGSFVDKKRNKKTFINSNNKDYINSIIVKSNAKLIFSAGYPYILPKSIVSIDKIFINSHPSILPLYKGRECIKRAYQNNERYHGCTLHYMNEKVDDGKIIYQKKFPLNGRSLDELYQYIFSKCEVDVIEQGLKKIL
tara:strand:+ start:45 stop:539 length:495 start_codon:yes stop_codon:yes gene_type:complete